MWIAIVLAMESTTRNFVFLALIGLSSCGSSEDLTEDIASARVPAPRPPRPSEVGTDDEAVRMCKYGSLQPVPFKEPGPLVPNYAISPRSGFEKFVLASANTGGDTFQAYYEEPVLVGYSNETINIRGDHIYTDVKCQLYFPYFNCARLRGPWATSLGDTRICETAYRVPFFPQSWLENDIGSLALDAGTVTVEAQWFSPAAPRDRYPPRQICEQPMRAYQDANPELMRRFFERCAEKDDVQTQVFCASCVELGSVFVLGNGEGARASVPGDP